MYPETFRKQLLFSTVRIEARNDSTSSSGTGFFVSREVNEGQQQIFLVTNKHVIRQEPYKKFTEGTLCLSKFENHNLKLGDTISFYLDNFTDRFLLHPDEFVDLAICNITQLIPESMLKDVFIKPIPIDMIPEPSDRFDAVEDIFFIGYPNSLFDQRNHLPLIRGGITSSPYEVDFEGEKRFVIDAHVFPGSSGSPVFIKEQDVKSGKRLGTEKYFFVGVISKVYCRDEEGILHATTPVAVSYDKFRVKQMIGLGICEKSNQIIDLIKIWCNKVGPLLRNNQ